MKYARSFDPRKEYVFRKRLLARIEKDCDKYPFVNEIDGKKVKPLSYCFGICEGHVVMCFWCEEIGGEVIE